MPKYFIDEILPFDTARVKAALAIRNHGDLAAVESRRYPRMRGNINIIPARTHTAAYMQTLYTGEVIP